MGSRGCRLDAFLGAADWQEARRSPLAGDASFRRYVRLEDGPRRAVLMDAPPATEDVRPFVAVARHLRSLGFSAPEIFAEDAKNGFLLLEDLGDDTYARLLDRKGHETPDQRTLYARAVDVLVDLHRRPHEEATFAGLPPYDERRMLDEVDRLVQWYLPAIAGRPTPKPVRRAFAEAWREAFPVVHAQPRTLMLFDFHVDNLVWLAGRGGLAACGLLDFQDAAAGPPAYDLMSLLEDARRDIPRGLKEEMLTRYRAAFPDLDRQGFDAGYAVLAAQRHTRVIGTFTRLCQRDGKPAYLVHIPRVWRMLENALAHPSLAAVADWFDRHAPPDNRGIPPWQVR